MKNGTRVSDIMPELVKVCSLDDLQEGVLNSFDVEDVLLMATIFDGVPIVSSRICTHKTYDLTKGHYSEGYVTCLLHTSVFELETGEAQNPPATDPLQGYKVVIQNNDVYIEI